MAEVSVVTAGWSGFTGSPGYTRLAFQPAVDSTQRQQIVDAARTFFNNLVALLKSTWTIQVSEIVQTYDIATSKLLTEIAAPVRPTIVTGSVLSTAAFVGGAGIQIKWTTGVVFLGHKVVGRTSIVPAANFSEADGTLTSQTVTTATNAGNALLAAPGPKFSVWSKRFDRSTNPPVQIAGALTQVTACSVKDEVSVLASRRH